MLRYFCEKCFLNASLSACVSASVKLTREQSSGRPEPAFSCDITLWRSITAYSQSFFTVEVSLSVSSDLIQRGKCNEKSAPWILNIGIATSRTVTNELAELYFHSPHTLPSPSLLSVSFYLSLLISPFLRHRLCGLKPPLKPAEGVQTCFTQHSLPSPYITIHHEQDWYSLTFYRDASLLQLH